MHKTAAKMQILMTTVEAVNIQIVIVIFTFLKTQSCMRPFYEKTTPTIGPKVIRL